MKAGPQADRFGAFAVAHLRDAALDFFEGLADGHRKSPRTQALQAALAAMTPEERAVVRRCVRAAVDHGVHDFLVALTDAHDRSEGVAVVVDGQDVADQSDGLHGELYGDSGWLARYSKHGSGAEPA
jgi:hypothetical protein